MKNLIIHPSDHSTSFLDTVYAPLENKTIITGGVTKKEVLDLIKEHDRVLMMGHGSPSGLFAVGQFNKETDSKWDLAFIIDQSVVPLLREKDNSVFIWCNADRFVKYHGLMGFYSGMFISEVGEATYCGIPGTDQELIDESNFGFCNIIAKHIAEEKTLIHENVKREYSLIAESNPVAFYNNMRLYVD